MPPLSDEQTIRVYELLRPEHPGMRLVKAEMLNDQVCEALFTVPDPRLTGRRVPMCSWICKSGTVQTWKGWGVP